MRISRLSKRDVVILGAMAILALSTVAYRHRVALEKQYEDLVLAVHPTASAAFNFGVKHFDASSPEEYDVDRAYDLFLLTKKLDPSYPDVYHNLGRIEFLRGELEQALDSLNKEFSTNPNPTPASYYVRALTKGYLKDYMGAAADYEAYFKITPANWGAINDYSWVLMKANLQEGAIAALDWGIAQWPENAWLLNNRAIALYELGRYKEAYDTAEKAQVAISKLTEADWNIAYPGNDPKVASAGLKSFKESAWQNFVMIRKAVQAKNAPR